MATRFRGFLPVVIDVETSSRDIGGDQYPIAPAPETADGREAQTLRPVRV